MLSTMQRVAALAMTGTMFMVPYGGGCDPELGYLNALGGDSFGFDIGYSSYDEGYYYDDYYYDDYYYEPGYYEYYEPVYYDPGYYYDDYYYY